MLWWVRSGTSRFKAAPFPSLSHILLPGQPGVRQGERRRNFRFRQWYLLAQLFAASVAGTLQAATVEPCGHGRERMAVRRELRHIAVHRESCPTEPTMKLAPLQAFPLLSNITLAPPV